MGAGPRAAALIQAASTPRPHAVPSAKPTSSRCNGPMARARAWSRSRMASIGVIPHACVSLRTSALGPTDAGPGVRASRRPGIAFPPHDLGRSSAHVRIDAGVVPWFFARAALARLGPIDQ